MEIIRPLDPIIPVPSYLPLLSAYVVYLLADIRGTPNIFFFWGVGGGGGARIRLVLITKNLPPL